MLKAKIIGTGMYVPSNVVTNDDLSKIMDTNDEWIVQRTGIRERRWIENDTISCSDVALPAAQMAIANAGLLPSNIDAIIFATLSPDHYFPGNGCTLQAKLGVKDIPAFDVRNQCSGFLYSLQMANAFIQTGLYQNILVVGAEVHSKGIEKATRGRDVSCIFGDGAGAIVVGVSNDASEILHITLGADGRFASDLWIEGMGSVFPEIIDQKQLDEGKHWPKMEGPKVFKHAITKMPAAVRLVLEKQGIGADSLKLLIPHQANLRISEMVQKSLQLRDDQVFNNIQKYGNTTAASIPIALHEAIQEGRIARGEYLAFASFGAGFTWGAALLKW